MKVYDINKERALKEDANYIDYLLTKYFNPIVFNMERDEYNLDVVMSSTFFDGIPIDKRVKLVYDVLYTNAKDVLGRRFVTVQPFNTKELLEAINLLGKDWYKKDDKK